MTATPPRADLRTLADEALDSLPDCPPDHWGGRNILDPCVDCQADAVLAAVLPEHRRMVLGEAANLLARERDAAKQVGDREYAAAMIAARKLIEGLAAAAPPAGLSAPVPAGNAPAVPEATPDDAPLGSEALALAEHFRSLGCGQVVDPVDLEDCGGMAEEVLRFLGTRGWAGPPTAFGWPLSVRSTSAPPWTPCPTPAPTRRRTTMGETDPRRATEEEIRTARAWVDETLPAWTHDSDTERQTEYAHALEILIFANGGRYSQPKVNEATALAAGMVPLADVLDALRDDDGFHRWRKALTGVRPEYPSLTTRHHLADYLAERFAPTTAPEGEKPWPVLPTPGLHLVTVEDMNTCIRCGKFTGRADCPTTTAPEGADERNGHG